MLKFVCSVAFATLVVSGCHFEKETEQEASSESLIDQIINHRIIAKSVWVKGNTKPFSDRERGVPDREKSVSESLKTKLIKNLDESCTNRDIAHLSSHLNCLKDSSPVSCKRDEVKSKCDEAVKTVIEDLEASFIK